MKLLLTGGAGYIGSHTLIALTSAGFTPIILDDFSNSKPRVLDRISKLIGKPVIWHEGSVENVDLVKSIIKQYSVSAVVHLAAFKAIGESVEKPLKYYDNNVVGFTRLLQAMDATGCRKLIFSSSATVYGDPASVPISENFPRSYTNPYGHSKLICEDILSELLNSNSDWLIGVLRYFNPVGAHPSGLIGENPTGIPNNLMPYLAQVAVGKLPYLNVYGNDYPTPDGTGVRDYIHVQDLAQGHVAAVNTLLKNKENFTVNLGCGQGYSVLEVIRAFEIASGRCVPYRLVPRRLGDIAQCYADVSLSKKLLNWRANYSLADMCTDAWRWQQSSVESLQ